MRSVVDSHAHIWRRARTPQPWIDAESMGPINRDFWVEDLATAQEDHGIQSSIVVQSSNSLRETLDLLAASEHPAIAGVVGWIDLTAGAGVVKQIAALRAAPGGQNLVGIRHLAHQDPDPRWLLRSDVGLGLELLASHRLTFDLVVTPKQLPAARTVIAAHRSVDFVLDHLGKPPIASGDLAAWTHDITRIAMLPNVVTKLSGLVVEADWRDWSTKDLAEPARVALETFGASRVLFGTDWPLVDLCGGLGPWMESAYDLARELSSDEQDALFRDNTVRTYLDSSRLRSAI